MIERNSHGQFIKGYKTEGIHFNVGKIRSKETRLKMSESRKGIKPSKKTKKLISRILKRMGHKPPTKYGKDHQNWVGDKVGYHGVHDWIEKERGKAKYLPCERAYDKTCKGSSQWSNISRQYHRNIDDFQVLCVSHHTRYDRMMKHKK